MIAMPNRKPNPVGKPRGRNGGRKPTVDPTGPAVPVTVQLPTWAAAVLDAAGTSRSAEARRILLAGLSEMARANNLRAE